jgi:predicted nucleotidyltransferase
MRLLENIDILPKERSSILQAVKSLKSDLPVSRVILFGSKARGTGAPDSDIDLLVLTSCSITPQLRKRISERLAQINLENDVELTSVVVSEQDWTTGLIHYTLIHSEVERDGCEV